MHQDPLPNSTETPKPPVPLEYSSPATEKNHTVRNHLSRSLNMILGFGLITLVGRNMAAPIGVVMVLDVIRLNPPMEAWFQAIGWLAWCGTILMICSGLSRHVNRRRALALAGLGVMMACTVMAMMNTEFLLMTLLTAIFFVFNAVLTLLNIFAQNKS